MTMSTQKSLSVWEGAIFMLLATSTVHCEFSNISLGNGTKFHLDLNFARTFAGNVRIKASHDTVKSH